MKKQIFIHLLLAGSLFFFSACSGKLGIPFMSDDTPQVKRVVKVEKVECAKKTLKTQKDVDKVQCSAYHGGQCVVW